MIRIENLTVSFGDVTPIRGLTLELPSRGRVAVTGKSGCGKTTLLRVLAGLIRPSAGTVSGLEGKRTAMVFQEDRLLPWLSALSNVNIICKDESRARALLADMELTGAEAEKYPAELSGGMQRRVAIARAIAFGGDVLIMDEPYKGLDEGLRLRVSKRAEEAFPLVIIAMHEPGTEAAFDAEIKLPGPAEGAQKA